MKRSIHWINQLPNTNTNYNSVAEKKAGMFGMKQIALFLKDELQKIIK